MLKNINKPNDNSNNDSVKERPVKALAKTSPLLPTVAIKRILPPLHIRAVKQLQYIITHTLKIDIRRI